MHILIAPLEALIDSRLTDPERRVLLALFSFRGKDTNTVWPSTTAIAGRALVGDVTWISKLTKQLADKGWLTKKRRGFTGGNEYRLTVPTEAEEQLILMTKESKLDEGPNLDPQSNLGEESSLDQEPNSNLDPQSKSKLDPDSKYKEQTIEQTIEQDKSAQPLSGNINPKRKARKRLPETLITEYIANCKADGVKTIPQGHAVFRHADESGIPPDFLRLGWLVFRDMMVRTEKKQKDWPGTFLNYVDRGWLGIWEVNRDGEYYLNTAGKQAQNRYGMEL